MPNIFDDAWWLPRQDIRERRRGDPNRAPVLPRATIRGSRGSPTPDPEGTQPTDVTPMSPGGRTGRERRSENRSSRRADRRTSATERSQRRSKRKIKRRERRSKRRGKVEGGLVQHGSVSKLPGLR